MRPTYSICITHYNNAPTIERALERILSQTDDDFEIIIADNMSTDGSENVLQGYAKERKIKLIRKRCTRGMGRQIAHQLATGDYEIAQIDLDDIIEPKLKPLLEFYHRRAEGKLLKVVPKPITIGPLQLITDIGGWRNLQRCEDWDIWSRAAKIDKFCWTHFRMTEKSNENRHLERKTKIGRMRASYINNREMVRLGRKLEESKPFHEKVALLLARIRSASLENYRDPFNLGFDSRDPNYELSKDEYPNPPGTQL